MTAPRPRRRRRRWPMLLLAALWLAAASVWGAAFMIDPGPPGSGVSVAAARPAGVRAHQGDADPPPAVPGPRGPVFARAAGIELRAVSAHVVAVAFHEASYGDAVDMVPMGRCVECRNPWRFQPERAAGDEELEYIVMHTRGREAGATSSADAVLPVGAEVVSPVSGTVSEVRRYRLYGRYPDVRVEIRPHEATDHRVVVLHLEGVTLLRGDEVEASVTRLGTARRFPFESQVDRFVPGRLPHVHMEVKRPATRGPNPRPTR